MPEKSPVEPAEPKNLVNAFIFHTTVRTAEIIKEIEKIREAEDRKDELYGEVCELILRHFNDIRVAHDAIERQVAAPEERAALQQALKMVSVEGIIYSIGRALIEMKGLHRAAKINTCFVRRTWKFWVHPENVETVIAMVVKHLPVSIFGDDGSGKISSRISSVYFDTPDFFLYQRRIKRDHKAQALRIRKYGESSIIAYVELKTHEDGWTGERTTKRRFLIHTKTIFQLAQGVDIWDDIKSINSPESHLLYLEVLSLIKELNLVPVVKTLYTRTAFQFPEDSSIRISVDTNLSMWNGPEGKAFPYAILEMKLEEGVEAEWVHSLMQSPLVIPVDKFSKYLHGCSVHYEEVPCVPYWYNQMGRIEKRYTHLELSEITRSKFQPLNEEIANVVRALAGLSNLPSAAVQTGSTTLHETPNKELQNSISQKTEQTMGNSTGDRYAQFFDGTSEKPPKETAVPAEPSGKHVVVPVRVEPKVFFANERTFLSWLHFAIFIGGIGAALMGLGDRKAALSGLCFIIVSVIFSLYALYLYIWRAKKIREKSPGPYDDHSGPIILVAVFLSAMVTSVFFKFPIK